VSLVVDPQVGARLPYMCRPVALARCLANLVDNAIKYAGAAEVRLAATESSVNLIVEDRGPGIAAEDRECAFAPFTRLDPSRNRDTGGTGLGLTIARAIARAHGGDVGLEDRPGGGLRVTVVLPR
jgi:signal transduction histidine kinase